jgi:hypothetical protein
VQEWSINAPGGSVIYGWVSEDNFRLYYSESFGSTRYIRMTERTSTADHWEPGSGVDAINARGNVANPSLTRDELTIVFASPDPIVPGEGQGGWDIWMGTRADKDDAFGNFMNLSSSVNGGSTDLHPRLSADGLTLYFSSNRSGVYQLFEATRPDTDSAFGATSSLSFLSFDPSGFSLQYPAISADGQDLYFAKAQTSQYPDYDIYVSHAVPAPGAVVLGIIGLSYAGWRCRRRTT